MDLKSMLSLKGQYVIVHRDINGKELSREVVDNLVTNEGFDYILNAALNGGTAISDWYFVPWTTNTTAAVAHTYAVPVNTEGTGYNEATRQAWGEGASSSQSVTNATAATLTATGALTVYGIGIVGGGSAATTKDDQAGNGTLLSTALFAAEKVLAAGETLDLTYTLSKTA